MKKILTILSAAMIAGGIAFFTIKRRKAEKKPVSKVAPAVVVPVEKNQDKK